MLSRVFICHAPEDEPCAMDVARLLEADGLPCWIMARNADPQGDPDAQALEWAERCKITVLILSGSANCSIAVRRQMWRAVSVRTIAIPLRIEAVEPGKMLEILLPTCQWFDGTVPPREERVKLMAEAIKGMI